MKERDNLKERAKSENNEDIYLAYKVKRNQVTDKIRHAKGDYYRSKFTNNSSTIEQ